MVQQMVIIIEKIASNYLGLATGVTNHVFIGYAYIHQITVCSALFYAYVQVGKYVMVFGD